MVSSIAMLWLLPLLVLTASASTLVQRSSWLMLGNLVMLGWLGSCPLGAPLVDVGFAASLFYFTWFILLIPLLGFVEAFLSSI